MQLALDRQDRLDLVDSVTPVGARLTAVRQVLDGLLDLPGARFACAADGSGGVVAFSGAVPDQEAARAVLGWGRRAAATLQDGCDLAVLTTGRHHVVLRRVTVAARPLLVHLVLDRHRSDLELSRRTLGSDEFRSRLAAIGQDGRRPPQPAGAWFPRAGRRTPPVAAPRPPVPAGPVATTAGTGPDWLVISGLLAARSSTDEMPQRHEGLPAA